MSGPGDALTQVWRAFAHTWRAMAADPGALTLLFVGGWIYAFFYPLPYREEVARALPVAVVDQDRSALSRQILRFALAHPGLRLVEVTAEPARAQALLTQQTVAGVLFIPPGLQRQVQSGLPAEVLVAGHGLHLLMAKGAMGGLAEAVGTVSAGAELKRLQAATPSAAQAQAQRQPLVLDPLALFNVREGYGSHVVPGVAVLIVQQTLLMAVALMFGTWAEGGGTPLPRRAAALAGLTLAFASVVLLNVAWWYGFVPWWQDFPRGGDPAALAAFALLFALAVSALAVALGLRFRSRERSAQLMLGLAMPVMFLSGLTWPAEALPEPLQALRWLLPSTAGVQGFLALTSLHAGLSELRTEVLALSLQLLAFGAVAWAVWRTGGRRPDEPPEIDGDGRAAAESPPIVPP